MAEQGCFAVVFLAGVGAMAAFFFAADTSLQQIAWGTMATALFTLMVALQLGSVLSELKTTNQWHKRNDELRRYMAQQRRERSKGE